MIDNTKIIERLIPGVNRRYGEGSAVLRQHLLRYRLAAAYIRRDDRVMDVACGSGYGSFLLAGAGACVTGIDRSDEAIEYASSTYHDERITWVCSPLEQYEAPCGVFDRVVCFETLEHLDDPKAALRSFTHALKRSGLLICSVPIIPSKQFDPFHLHDFSEQSFLCLLDACGYTVLDKLFQEGTFLTVVAAQDATPDLEPPEVSPGLGLRGVQA
ncbi:MAG: class I SAM-dependent methyltransferase [Desulfuromonadaceae bacterium]